MGDTGAQYSVKWSPRAFAYSFMDDFVKYLPVRYTVPPSGRSLVPLIHTSWKGLGVSNLSFTEPSISVTGNPYSLIGQRIKFHLMYRHLCLPERECALDSHLYHVP